MELNHGVACLRQIHTTCKCNLLVVEYHFNTQASSVWKILCKYIAQSRYIIFIQKYIYPIFCKYPRFFYLIHKVTTQNILKDRIGANQAGNLISSGGNQDFSCLIYEHAYVVINLGLGVLDYQDPQIFPPECCIQLSLTV